MFNICWYIVNESTAAGVREQACTYMHNDCRRITYLRPRPDCRHVELTQYGTQPPKKNWKKRDILLYMHGLMTWTDGPCDKIVMFVTRSLSYADAVYLKTDTATKCLSWSCLTLWGWHGGCGRWIIKLHTVTCVKKTTDWQTPAAHSKSSQMHACTFTQESQAM